MNAVEVAATATSAASVALATFNRVATWWVGIASCLLFGWVFFTTQLYADVTLQAFFVVTNAIGWWAWLHGDRGAPLPVRRTPPRVIALLLGAAVAVTAAYGALLHRFTDAYAPFVDSAVLAFSVLAQLLLMRRRYETWWCWLLVDTICVPLYLARGLTLTATLFAAFWVNAVVALVRWRALVQPA